MFLRLAVRDTFTWEHWQKQQHNTRPSNSSGTVDSHRHPARQDKVQVQALSRRCCAGKKHGTDAAERPEEVTGAGSTEPHHLPAETDKLKSNQFSRSCVFLFCSFEDAVIVAASLSTALAAGLSQARSLPQHPTKHLPQGRQAVWHAEPSAQASASRGVYLL